MATYEPLSVFREPCCLIENCSDGTLKICSVVLDQLSKISSPLNVIAITGPYRTGKSYLLNRLAGKKEGFLLGSTIEATTKGIWAWCRPHPERKNEVILLLDTEGLGDIQKGNEENDNWIFAISVLVSSTLVYNCLNTIGQDGLSKLHYVTELTKRIKTKSTSGNKDGGDFYRIFPNFIWAVRDFHLRLKKQGQQITPDEYLADALQLKKGTSKAVDDYNRPRQCITQFFEDKKCFLFPIPAKESEKMEELETLPESELNPKFLLEAERFSCYIYTETFPKTASGQPIHGKMFCYLLENYVSVIQNGEIPCVEDAVKNMAEKENAEALKVSVNLYSTEMNERLTSINSGKELFKAHQDCKRMALDRFLSMSKLDEQQKYQSKFKEEIGRKIKEICREKGIDLEEVESKEDIMIAELNDTDNHLKGLQKNLIKEVQNNINELDRKIRQRSKEIQQNKDEIEILKRQEEKMKQEKDEHERDLKAISDGGSSFGKFLNKTGSILVKTLKVGLEVALVAGKTVYYAASGAQHGANIGSLVPAGGPLLGALVGGVAGAVFGLGKGIYDVISFACSDY